MPEKKLKAKAYEVEIEEYAGGTGEATIVTAGNVLSLLALDPSGDNIVYQNLDGPERDEIEVPRAYYEHYPNHRWGSVRFALWSATAGSATASIFVAQG